MVGLQNAHLKMWSKNMVGKTLLMLERPQKFALEATKIAQKDIMGAKKLMF
jgi:hypothetical protein